MGGVDAMEIGIYIRKGLIFTIGACYRSACNHPFLVGFGFFVFLLYLYLPALFAFLLSSSPVIVCTAALLGTLLSFGNPNIPEVEEEEDEKEEEKTGRTTQHEISSLKTGVVQGDLVLEKDQIERFSAETCSRDIKEKSDDEKDLARSPKTQEAISTTVVIGETLGEIHDRKQVIEEESESKNQEFIARREIHHDRKQLMEEEERELQDQGFREMRELYEKEPLMEQARVELQFPKDDDRKEIKVPHTENGKPAVEFPSSHSEEPFGSIQDFSSWKQMEEHDDDESLDSDSDGAESSSPDASMADIIPMLDELHPLLESESAQPAFIPLNDSDTASERSSEGSGEDVENQEEEEEDDEDEVQHGVQDDGTKAVVTWTEDDERNLMDLGNSELERNRRLESLIARRRARKNFRTTLAEKNLIDLDASDPPFPIAPISTARHNPFDIHYDSNEAMGLPPIPGSAPSVLLPRRNPFDLPYDPLEERPDLTGGSFEEEFITAHEKDMFFRRHESFSLGSSFFGDFKQEKQHSKFRPYFVAEHSERAGYPTFQRQLSGRSDSKVSSVTETESLLSFADQDDHKNLNQQELSQEGKPMPTIEHTPDNATLKSSSSSELSLVDIDTEDKADADVIRTENKGADGENAHEKEANLQNMQSVSLFMETKPTQVYVESEENGTKHTRSSSSSSSEVNEKIFHVSTDEANPDPTNDDNDVENPNNSMQSSAMDSDLTTKVVGLDDHQTKEPVYDWSPLAVEKTLSGVTIIQEALCYADKGVLTSTSSFIESDKPMDALESHSARVPEERTNSAAYDKFSLHQDNIADDTTSGIEGSWAASSHLSAVEENEMRSREVTMVSEHDVINVGFSGEYQNSDDLSVQMVSSEVERVLSDPDSSSSETDSEDEENVNEELDPQPPHVEAPLLSFDQEMNTRAPHFDTDEADSKASSSDLGGSSESLTSTASEKLPPLLEKSTSQSSSDGDHEKSEELPSPTEVSNKEANFINEFHEEVFNDHENRYSSNLSPSISGHFSLPMDVSHDKLPVCQADFVDDLHDAIQNVVNSPIVEHLDIPQETIGFEMYEKENVLEGIKEIDGGLLTELDVVGDFRAEELGTNTSHTENKLVVGEQENLTGHKVVEDNSTKDIEYESDNLIKHEVGVDQQVPLETGAESVNPIFEDQYPNASERNSSKLHVFEASSIEDIDSVFEQLRQRVEESSISELVHDQLAKEMEVTYSDVEPHNEGPNQMQTVGVLPVFEARYVEDADSTSEQEHERKFKKPIVPELNEETVLEEAEAGSTEVKVPNKNPNEIEDNLELPVLEARSLEDIDSVFKQLHEGEIEKPVLLEPIYDALVLDKTEVGSAGIEHANHQDRNSMEMGPSAVEERSLEDKDSASKQLEEGEIEKPVALEPIQNDSIVQESNVQSAEPKPADRDSNSTDFDSELLVVEARSVEDINSAFSQLHEGSNHHEKHAHYENVESRRQVLKSQDSAEVTSYSHEEPEVRSIEEIDLVPNQVYIEENIVEDLQKENSEVGSSETLAKEIETAMETKSDFKGSVVQQETKAGVEESKSESIETSEDSRSRKAGLRKKKSGSSKSSSSSSYSSSSSDSD